MSILKWISRHRGTFIALPLVFSCICFYKETENDQLLWPAGTMMILLGLIVRIWSQQHIQRRLKLPQQLTTTGPYALVRNPLYIGNIVINTGATVLSELLWMVPITFLWCLGIYSLVVRYEERRLLERYGELFHSYMVETPRWFPRSLRIRKSDSITQYLRTLMKIETSCLLILIPFMLKEFVSPLFEH